MPIPLFQYTPVQAYVQPQTPRKQNENFADAFLKAYAQGVSEAGEDRRLDKQLSAGRAEAENQRAFEARMKAEDRGPELTPDMRASLLKSGVSEPYISMFGFTGPGGEQRIRGPLLQEALRRQTEQEKVPVYINPETGEVTKMTREQVANVQNLPDLLPATGLPEGTLSELPSYLDAVTGVPGLGDSLEPLISRVTDPPSRQARDDAWAAINTLTELAKFGATVRAAQISAAGRSSGLDPAKITEVMEIANSYTWRAPEMDPETGEYITDSNGELVYKEIPKPMILQILTKQLMDERSPNWGEFWTLFPGMDMTPKIPVELLDNYGAQFKELTTDETERLQMVKVNYLPWIDSTASDEVKKNFADVMWGAKAEGGHYNGNLTESFGNQVQGLTRPDLGALYLYNHYKTGRSGFNKEVRDIPGGLPMFYAKTGIPSESLDLLERIDPDRWGSSSVTEAGPINRTTQEVDNFAKDLLAHGNPTGRLLWALGLDISGSPVPVPVEPLSPSRMTDLLGETIFQTASESRDTAQVFGRMESLIAALTSGNTSAFKDALDAAIQAQMTEIQAGNPEFDPATMQHWQLLDYIYSIMFGEEAESAEINPQKMAIILREALEDARFKAVQDAFNQAR